MQVRVVTPVGTTDVNTFGQLSGRQSTEVVVRSVSDRDPEPSFVPQKPPRSGQSRPVHSEEKTLQEEAMKVVSSASTSHTHKPLASLSPHLHASFWSFWWHRNRQSPLPQVYCRLP